MYVYIDTAGRRPALSAPLTSSRAGGGGPPAADRPGSAIPGRGCRSVGGSAIQLIRPEGWGRAPLKSIGSGDVSMAIDPLPPIGGTR